MKIRGITSIDLDIAVARANAEYAGNLTPINVCSRRDTVQFRLGVLDSRAYGARLASSGKRHTPSASWEAHRDVFREVFKINPEAVIVTAVATYKGSEHFERTFRCTADYAMGSRAEPTTIAELSIVKG